MTGSGEYAGHNRIRWLCEVIVTHADEQGRCPRDAVNSAYLRHISPRSLVDNNHYRQGDELWDHKRAANRAAAVRRTRTPRKSSKGNQRTIWLHDKVRGDLASLEKAGLIERSESAVRVTDWAAMIEVLRGERRIDRHRVLPEESPGS